MDAEGERSSFPVDIYAQLNSPCLAFPRKRVWQTHMLVWIPKTMNGEPLTLNSFGRVLKEYFPDNNAYNGYQYIWRSIVAKHGETGVAKSGWVLMIKDVLPGSRGESYTDQQAQVVGLNYEVPKMVEAVVCISTRYFKSGEHLFSDKPWTYTRCQEEIRGYQVLVGGFSAAGLIVDYFSDYVYDSHGVAALRKFGP